MQENLKIVQGKQEKKIKQAAAKVAAAHLSKVIDCPLERGRDKQEIAILFNGMVQTVEIRSFLRMSHQCCKILSPDVISRWINLLRRNPLKWCNF